MESPVPTSRERSQEGERAAILEGGGITGHDHGVNGLGQFGGKIGQFFGVAGEFLCSGEHLLLGLPVEVAALLPMGEVGVFNGTASEFAVEDLLHFREV